MPCDMHIDPKVISFIAITGALIALWVLGIITIKLTDQL